MKKRRSFKIFSLMLAMLMVFAFAGCSGGGADEGGMDPSFLAGTKVLTRPEEYDFSEAVGENCTENYYNVFVKFTLQYLYGVYRNAVKGSSTDEKDALFGLSEGYTQLDTSNGDTFTTATAANMYYLYETPRYFVSEFTKSGDTRTIKINTSQAWTWSVPRTEDLKYDIEYFNGRAGTSGTTYTFTEDGETLTLEGYYTTVQKLEDYHQYYYVADGTDGGKAVPTEGSKDFFYDSPYYHQAYNLTGSAPSNLYQDALEYVVYMLVLGKNLTDDELKINVTSPSNITVGAARTEIKTALGNAKALYKKTGNYVGVTQKNMDDLRDFILTQVIGVTLDSNGNVATKGVFDVTLDSGTKRFNKNYKAVVSNIIKYACTLAPIGKTEDNKDIYLSDNYPVATITDYFEDHFSIDFEDFDETDPSAPSRFAALEAAEYQSIILYPEAGDVGKHLLDLGLCFEYFENPSETKTMAASISIDVGFRYYNSTTQAIQDIFLDTVTVGYGKNGEQEDTGYPLTDFWACENEDVLANVAPQTTFTSPGAITPTEGNLFKKTMNITSGSPASAYYSVVETDGVQHIVLNHSLMTCDFMEVYFVVHKDSPNTCYAFKVATTCFFEDV